MTKWCEFSRFLTATGGIDLYLEAQISTETTRWKAVLTRILDCVLFLSQRNLPFRGTNEVIGAFDNGLFLGLLELIAKAEPLISEHLRKSSTVSGKVSYLSATIQNEFISILANNVVQKIIHEVRNAKYYSIIIDSTPDVSHIEQLSFVLRYTYFDHHYRKVEIIERFIGYVELGSTTGESIAHKIIENISKLGLDILDCRGQGYDNGANMAGFVKGVQNRI